MQNRAQIVQCKKLRYIVRRSILPTKGCRAMRLQDKVAIITGAGRGIGQATAVKFATEGAKVVVCDLSPEWIEQTVMLCKETRGEAMGYVADVRDIKALEAMVAATVNKWGRVDCLVNNAGIVQDAQLKNMTEE